MLKQVRFWIGLLVGLAFLVLFLYRTDLSEMGHALAQANYIFLLPAMGAYFVAVWLRTLRWQILLAPLGRVSRGRLFPVVVIGYMANNILPVRLGELARAYLLGEKEKMSKAAVLATVLVERLMDGVALIFFLLLTLPFLPLGRWLGDLGRPLGLSLEATQALFLTLSALFLGILLLLLLMVSWPGLGKGIAGLLERRLPGGWGSKGSQMLLSFMGGLRVLRSPGQLLGVFLVSCLVWLAEAVMYYLITFSFQLGQPFSVLL
ncbi:MAG: lysylphosphatidylglycerol synthase transmembrane domain-containing protein, partial [Chloroflexota bacterium]|nr:lysylphosphatidylglycerol synthase transmembrane domain-containing protein [Chloroflexota bacterium]